MKPNGLLGCCCTVGWSAGIWPFSGEAGGGLVGKSDAIAPWMAPIGPHGRFGWFWAGGFVGTTGSTGLSGTMGAVSGAVGLVGLAAGRLAGSSTTTASLYL